MSDPVSRAEETFETRLEKHWEIHKRRTEEYRAAEKRRSERRALIRKSIEQDNDPVLLAVFDELMEFFDGLRRLVENARRQ